MDNSSFKVENREPKPINSVWKNVDKIDTGFRFEKNTYFFKGNYFYEFDETNQTIHLDQPQVAVEYWMNCSSIQQKKVKSAAFAVQYSIFFVFSTLLLRQLF